MWSKYVTSTEKLTCFGKTWSCAESSSSCQKLGTCILKYKKEKQKGRTILQNRFYFQELH